MKKNLFVVITLTVLLTLLGCSKNAANSKSDSNNQPQKTEDQTVDTQGNTKAPNFTLESAKGKKVSLSDYAGKIVIVDFWATWCPPCRKGIPDLISLQKKYRNKIAVIGISLDGDNTKADVVPFIKEHGINYTILYATQKVVADYGNIEAIPTSFIIDKKGNIVAQRVGLTPKEYYEKEIKSLLGNS
jgi:thiol-disulfide isomerase/thioredoxin